MFNKKFKTKTLNFRKFKLNRSFFNNTNKARLALCSFGLIALGTIGMTVGINLVNAASFTITSISPNVGPIAGGQTVTITGTNLQQTLSLEWKQISAGSDHTCAVTTDGKAFCWGDNYYGQLGNGTKNSSNIPVEVIFSDLGSNIVKQVSAGNYYTCAIVGDAGDNYHGNAYCWGANSSGQLGIGNTSDRILPIMVENENFIQISAGFNHTCAVTDYQEVFCWGDNNYGQIDPNDYSTGNYLEPYNNWLIYGITQVSVGYGHTCIINYNWNNNVYCWGDNNQGQLGNDPMFVGSDHVFVNPSFPVYPTSIDQISAGYNHTCAVASSGQAYCWGANDMNQIGDGNFQWTVPYPSFVSTLGSSVTQISAGDYHTCAVTNTGDIYCWGLNSNGQSGSGSYQIMLPELVSSGSFAQVSAGGNHSCAIDSNNAYCWGANWSGQLGNNSNYDSDYPVTVVILYYL